MKFSNFFAFLVLLIAVDGCKKKCSESDLDMPGCWEMTFNEDFLSNNLDTAVWTKNFSWGQTSYGDHQQLYVDSAFSIRSGILYIECKRQAVEGIVYDEKYNQVLKTYDYSSGLINTSNSFSQQYGFFEIRCRVPFGIGFWPAFWLMPYNKWPPEIDIFEIKGSEPGRLHMANHFRNLNGKHTQKSKTIDGPNFSINFHVFAVEWNVKEIIWYLDGKQVYKSQVAIPQEKMWMVVNLALGGAFPGFADGSTPSPAYLEIDYIRAYKRN